MTYPISAVVVNGTAPEALIATPAPPTVTRAEAQVPALDEAPVTPVPTSNPTDALPAKDSIADSSIVASIAGTSETLPPADPSNPSKNLEDRIYSILPPTIAAAAVTCADTSEMADARCPTGTGEPKDEEAPVVEAPHSAEALPTASRPETSGDLVYFCAATTQFAASTTTAPLTADVAEHPADPRTRDIKEETGSTASADGEPTVKKLRGEPIIALSHPLLPSSSISHPTEAARHAPAAEAPSGTDSGSQPSLSQPDRFIPSRASSRAVSPLRLLSPPDQRPFNSPLHLQRPQHLRASPSRANVLSFSQHNSQRTPPPQPSLPWFTHLQDTPFPPLR